MKLPFAIHKPSMIRLSELNPAAYNPRKISPTKYEALKESIRSEGFVESVVVQKEGLRIVGGHQRVRAAKELAIEAGVAPPEIPCVVLDIGDERAKKLNIKLNNIKGDFEARSLGELLIDLYEDKIPEEEALDLGFDSEADAMKLIHLIEPPEVLDVDPKPPSEFGRSITLSIEFGTVERRNEIKKLLIERATLEKKKPGDIIADLLAPKIRSRAEAKAKTKAPKKARASA